MEDNLAIKHYWYSSETINFINSNNYLVYSIKRGSFIANLQKLCTGTTGIDCFGWNSTDNWKGKKALLTILFSFTSLHVQQWIYLYLVIFSDPVLLRVRYGSSFLAETSFLYWGPGSVDGQPLNPDMAILNPSLPLKSLAYSRIRFFLEVRTRIQSDIGIKGKGSLFCTLCPFFYFPFFHFFFSCLPSARGEQNYE